MPPTSPCLRATLLAAVRAVAGDEAVRVHGADPPVTERILALASGLADSDRRLLEIGARVLALTALPWHGRTFARLDGARAARHLERMAASPFAPLRRLAHVVGLLARFAWYGGEESHAAIGYDGPWLGRVAVSSLPPPRLGDLEPPAPDPAVAPSSRPEGDDP